MKVAVVFLATLVGSASATLGGPRVQRGASVESFGSAMEQGRRKLSSNMKSNKSSMGGMGNGYYPNLQVGEGQCIICTMEAGDRPDPLYLEWNPNGMNSGYQDEEKATCREGTYPADTTVMAYGVSYDVQEGTVIMLTGRLDAETDFIIEGWTGGDGDNSNECYIHTSCSQPLVAGDQIGPWIVRYEENECLPEAPPFLNPFCDICEAEGRPASLTFQYNSQGSDPVYAEKSDCSAGTYPTDVFLQIGEVPPVFPVSDGDIFTVYPPDGERFDANTLFQIRRNRNGPVIHECNVHTSCSDPLIPGDTYGPYTLLDENENDECQEVCNICGYDKDRPDSLTFQYIAEGVDSTYQDRDDTCGAGSYRANGARIQANGQTFVLNDGDIFTVEGPFEANTEFVMTNGNLDCAIHTSCSQPLIQGDQLGPFLILAGGYCPPEEPPTPPPAECVDVCSPVDPDFCGQEVCGPANIDPPEFLTFRYQSGEGRESLFQDVPPSGFPVCGPAQRFPFEAVIFVNGQTFDVVDQSTFDVQGPFGDELIFEVRNRNDLTEFVECAIVTSCLDSIVIGDILGAFQVVAGNNCEQDYPECVMPDATMYNCGETMTFDFTYENVLDFEPLDDDWIGIYPCDDRLFYHPEIWQWTCGSPFCDGALFEGTIVFDSLPNYNQAGPHYWPVVPIRYPDGTVQDCFRAVILRNDGPSVPPYVEVCRSAPFFVNVDDSPNCPTRDVFG